MSAGGAYAKGDAGGASTRTVATTELLAHCTAVMRASGLEEQAASFVAASLVDAEASGVSSHGVTRCRIYSRRLRSGLVDAQAEPVVVSQRPAGALLDARNAIGQVGAEAGVRLASSLAREAGVAGVGVGGSNHCGTLAYYSRRIAAEDGMVVLAMSTAPSTMVYHGGRTRAVGTNPISIAVPRSEGPPIVVDMATSATARGRIILANQVGADIPPGWAVDEAGRPTTNASDALAGSVLPFAGPKGSGLAMMVELLAGAMVAGATGAGIGDMYEDWTRAQGVGHLFLTMDPDTWLGRNAFAEQVESFVDTVHSLPPADGFEQVLLPGELEERARARAAQDGVAISEAVLGDLQSLADELGVDRRLAAAEVSDQP